MSSLYPIYLKLEGRRVLLVGGGPVAERRAIRLAESGALLTVVSPELEPGIEALAREGRIEIRRRKFEVSDLDGVALVLLAAGDPAVLEEVRRETSLRGIWLNAADREEACDFHVPAVASQGSVQVAVSTGGTSPQAAARIREALGEWLAARRGFLEESSELGRRGPARSGSARPGIVYLVGAGPGDPGLLTARALELLASADIVLHDRLVSEGVLAKIPLQAEKVYVGKEVGCPVRADVEKLLIENARAGKRVVRLKGGDPYLFGRGGEEAAALTRAGVSYEVVPGVSALGGALAAAGIPMTLRGVSSEVVVRSGHDGDGVRTASGERGRTHVYFMAASRLPRVIAELRSEGVPADSPVAIVMRGTLPGQRTLRSTLDRVEAEAARHGVVTPALLVVGDVVRACDEGGLTRLLDEVLRGLEEAPGGR